MKRLLTLFTLTALFMLTLPVFAQESTAAPLVSSDSTLTYILLVVLVVVFIAGLYNIQVIIKLIAPLVPPESVAGIAASITPAVADLILNNVNRRIPTDIDDKAVIEALRQKGYTVTRDEAGDYHTAPSKDVSGKA